MAVKNSQIFTFHFMLSSLFDSRKLVFIPTSQIYLLLIISSNEMESFFTIVVFKHKSEKI